MKRLFLLCGLPFSGKSTAANVLARSHGADVISLDAINATRGLTHGGEGAIPPEQWQVTHQIALSQVREQMQSDRDIVIDDTNCFLFLRDNYRQLALEAGYKAQLIVMDTPVEEIRERIARNCKVPSRHHVSEETLSRLLEVFEWPGPEEQSIIWSIFAKSC